jgi:transposase
MDETCTRPAARKRRQSRSKSKKLGNKEQLYLVEKISLHDIGKMFGVARNTVGTWAQAYGIPIRSGSEASLKGAVKPSKEELEKLYIADLKTTIEIAAVFDVHKTTVSNWLHSYELDTRLGTFAHSPNITRPSDEELYHLYIENGMTLNEIADMCGAAQATTVCNWMAAANISARTPEEIGRNGRYMPNEEELRTFYIDNNETASSIAQRFGFEQSAILRQMRVYGIQTRSISESKLYGKQKPSDSELYDMYIVDRKSSVEIGDMLGVSPSTVARWIVVSGAEIRSNSEAHAKELHNRWMGGISNKYCYHWTEELRESIREKHGRKCFLCDKTEEDNGQRLSVHHVDMNKNQGCGGHSWKLVPLCKRCHARAHANRYKWYTVIMHKLYLESSAQFLNMVHCI